ncbi:MAG: twin-arginine translocase subunit TatC [Burkholderiales bacterium]|jgi:sec-independent protein translocase protein TatC|nr:twin-arginine translocase subunit TatC [Burkholderiales bacterium]
MNETHESENAREETFVSHLIELRTRLVRAIGAVFVIFIGLFYWRNNIYTFLVSPLSAVLPENSSIIATEVTAPFLVPMKVTLMVAFLIALPFVLWQIWAFVAPGLYRNEKRLVLPVMVSSVTLFFVGMAFAYFIVFPAAFHFLASVTPEGVNMMTDMDKYWSFALTMFLAFGTTFETPVVVVVLVTLGVVSVAQLKNARPYVIVGAFTIAAVITPPDVLSQLFLAFPLWLLFELGLLLSQAISKKEDAPTQS